MQGPGIESIAQAGEERARDRRQTARRLLGELAPYRGRLLYLALLTIVSALTTAASPWLIGLAIDDAILGGDSNKLSIIMLALLTTYLASLATARGQIVTMGFVGQSIMRRLRLNVFGKVQTLPIAYFDRQASGDVQSRLVNDIETLNLLFSPGLSQVLSQLFGLVGVLIAMLLLDWRLALASGAVIPLMVLTTRVFAGRARRAYRETRVTVGAVSAQLEQDISGVREAQAFNRTQLNVDRFRERNAANRDANVQAVGVTAAFAPTIDVLSTVGLAIVIGLGGYLVLNGLSNVGVVAAFLLYVQGFFRPVQFVSQLIAQIQPALAGAERIYELGDQPDEIEPTRHADLPVIEGAIEFDQVSFSYDAGQPVLRDVSFSVRPGETIALVGTTGAGKTTIANLVARFYDVDSGAVRIDGCDIRTYPRRALRRQLALVPQEAFLFTGTVAEIISYGRPEAPRESIEHAARTVRADQFINQLPDGYATQIGEGGTALSQGQRQLLAFARAILVDPRILILDEATSRVDTRTEMLIQDALTTLLTGRTSIVIAHRLSTIERADRILVIEGGEIVEQGTHRDLLAADGQYASLYRRQAQSFEQTGAAAVLSTAGTP